MILLPSPILSFLTWGGSACLFFSNGFHPPNGEATGAKNDKSKRKPSSCRLSLYYFLSTRSAGRGRKEGPLLFSNQNPSASSSRLPEGEISFPHLLTGRPEGSGSQSHTLYSYSPCTNPFRLARLFELQAPGGVFRPARYLAGMPRLTEIFNIEESRHAPRAFAFLGEKAFRPIFFFDTVRPIPCIQGESQKPEVVPNTEFSCLGVQRRDATEVSERNSVRLPAAAPAL